MAASNVGLSNITPYSALVGLPLSQLPLQSRPQSPPSSPINSASHVCPSSIQNSSIQLQRRTMSFIPSPEAQKKKPWRYQGYPGFCRTMASSGDAFILRRFNRLNARVILSLQDEIVQLEDELDRFDDKSMRGPESTERSSSLRQDPLPRRMEILQELKPLLKEYNEYVLAYSELRSRPSAQNYQVENVQNWFEHHPKAIDEAEQQFISKGDDVISITPQSKSWLRLLIEKINPKVLRSIFRAKERPDRVQSDYSFYVSNKRMNTAETFLIMVLGLAALLAPMWWLNRIENASSDYRLVVINGFIVFFTASLASATVEKPFEVLIGTAGYAAVLMVFMQQSGSSTSCPTP